MASAWGCLTQRPDVVLASSPPLPVGVAAASSAHRHRVPWVLDVRDLWPEAAVAVGELGSARAVRVAERLERFLYRDASAITTVTAAVRRPHRRTSSGAEDKIELVPNGTTQFWLDAAELEPDRAALGLPGRPVRLDVRGQPRTRPGSGCGDRRGCAARVRSSGSSCSATEPRGRRSSAARRELRPGWSSSATRCRESRRREVLRASDALLVSLSPDPVLEAFVPSKLFDFCALGRPVLVAANGEPQRLVREAGAAVPVPAGDPTALAAAVRAIRDRSEGPDTHALRDLSRSFAEAHLRDHQIARLEALLADVASATRSPARPRPT